MVRQRIQAFSRLGHLASRRPFSYSPQSTIRSQSLYASRPKYTPRSIPQTQARSYTAFEQFKHDLRGASRDNPFLFAVGASFAIGSIFTFFYVIYDHATSERPYYERFPPELSKHLRKAVYLGEIEQRPMLAFDQYKQALAAAERLGMHPFSDDVLGIKISVSEMFEKTGYIKPAIEILERTMRDCRTWVESGRRRQSINDLERRREVKHGAVDADPAAVGADAETPQLGFDEEKQRDKVMKRTVGMAAHVSYLYSSNYVKNSEKALDAAIEASNWSHTEIQRRRDLNLPVSTASGDDFLNLNDAAIVHASLAELYSERENHDLAASLYRHAAELLREDEEGRPNSCLQATYIGSVGAEMTNQWSKDHLAATASKQPSAPSALDASKQWLTKSLDMASHIKPPVRDELCEQCSGTALYNLGAMAVMCNDHEAAKTHFEKAKSFFQKMGDLQQVDNINRELDDLRK